MSDFNNVKSVAKNDKINEVVPKQIIKEPKEISIKEPMQKVIPLYCSSIPDEGMCNEQAINLPACTF